MTDRGSYAQVAANDDAEVTLAPVFFGAAGLPEGWLSGVDPATGRHLGTARALSMAAHNHLAVHGSVPKVVSMRLVVGNLRVKHGPERRS